MHLFFEGIAPAMLRHWQGNYFKNDYLNDNIYTIDKKNWNEIGKTMAYNSKNMPAEFGRPPIHISHHKAFKAEEWINWTILYSIPLLLPYLPTRYVLYCFKLNL